MTAIEVGAAAAGLVAVWWFLDSVVRTLVVPRPERVWLTAACFEFARRVTASLAARSTDSARRHRLRGAFAPFVLISLPLLWTIGLIVAFTPIFWALSDLSLLQSFELSGSSLTTLGFVPAPNAATRLVAVIEALIGLAVVALMIGFLPTVYGAFSRREVSVGRLTTRAGEPAHPAVLLERLSLIGRLDAIGELWADWEDWFAELGETHTTFPALIYFRSATIGRSWLEAAEATLDTAAVVRAAELSPQEGRADTLIRAGYLALGSIAELYALDPGPEPADPAGISVTRAQFDRLMADLASRGVVSTVDPDIAWEAFAGWRVNYDRAVVGLRRLIGDVPSHWD